MEILKNNSGVLQLLSSKPSSLESLGNPFTDYESVWIIHLDPAALHPDFLWLNSLN